MLVLSVVVLFLPSREQQWIAAGVRSTLLRPFVIVQLKVAGVRARALEWDILRREVDSLVAITLSHRVLAEENRRLRTLLGLKERLGPGWVQASVVRSGTVGSESMFLLDVGSEDGVEMYAPVVSGQGLIGVVREVNERSAVGMDWTHPDFRVSAMDTAGVAFGMVSARRGESREADRLVFPAPFHALVEDGTVVVASGLAGVWPRGVAIGRVEGLADSDPGWRKTYWLRPMVEVGSVTDVLVGVGAGAGGDLMSIWPTDSVVTGEELAVWFRSEQVRLEALEDSAALLRSLLPPPPDGEFEGEDDPVGAGGSEQR